MPHALNEQAQHLAYVLSEVRDRGARTVEATQSAEQEYVDLIRRPSNTGTRFYRECTPSYYNSEGKKGSGSFSDMFRDGPIKFFPMLNEWREDGNMTGIEPR